MKRVLLFLSIPVLVVAFALITRPYSLGMKLSKRAVEYSRALSTGRTEEAMSMMSSGTAQGFSLEFLGRLEGTVIPSDFKFDGSDTRGLRMVGSAGDSGSRVIWFSTENDILVTHDTALDNILGSAVVLCRENAMADPDGSCPVSGISYEYNTETGLVVCTEGHLGEGLILSSNACSLRRDSVASELAEYLEAGYSYPGTLEDLFILSDEEYGRRGGYQCPDNGYKYYELRDGEVYCPFHEEYSEAVVIQ